LKSLPLRQIVSTVSFYLVPEATMCPLYMGRAWKSWRGCNNV